MRNITVVAFLLAALLSASASLVAETIDTFETGNSLLAQCKRTGYGNGYCLGYIVSASDMQSTLVDWGYMSKRFCLPEGVSKGQLEAVVTKYLEKNPENLHLNAGGLVANVLARTFPCNE